jgi:hypothetical protein
VSALSLESCRRVFVLCRFHALGRPRGRAGRVHGGLPADWRKTAIVAASTVFFFARVHGGLAADLWKTAIVAAFSFAGVRCRGVETCPGLET